MRDHVAGVMGLTDLGYLGLDLFYFIGIFILFLFGFSSNSGKQRLNNSLNILKKF